ncbi:Rrp15 protein [Saccharomycopsis crataegensis]|uniref:Rrp15 protein n=1 Tax=Saccharomycopsis crataegensis TaxID=43959 RepID=A0AAV5QW30_9ASCO|nr:Rrp15 protein [Saccharomycopsis crataegensis]
MASGSKGSIRITAKKQKLQDKSAKPTKSLPEKDIEEDKSISNEEEEEEDDDDDNDDNDSEEEDEDVDELEDDDDEVDLDQASSSDDSDDEKPDDGDIPHRNNKPKRHKNDDGTESFSNAIGALLNSHLKAHDRADPIFVRQKKSILKQKQDEKLELKARKILNSEKKLRNEKSHITNLLPSAEASNARQVLEYERKLKKTAQRGVIKLFNAILTTQVGAQNEVKDEKMLFGKKEEKMNEISKEKFMDLVKAAK